MWGDGNVGRAAPAFSAAVMAGRVPAIHVERHTRTGVDARAFAAPKRLRPRRRDKPGHDEGRELRSNGRTESLLTLDCF